MFICRQRYETTKSFSPGLTIWFLTLNHSRGVEREKRKVLMLTYYLAFQSLLLFIISQKPSWQRASNPGKDSGDLCVNMRARERGGLKQPGDVVAANVTATISCAEWPVEAGLSARHCGKQSGTICLRWSIDGWMGGLMHEWLKLLLILIKLFYFCFMQSRWDYNIIKLGKWRLLKFKTANINKNILKSPGCITHKMLKLYHSNRQYQLHWCMRFSGSGRVPLPQVKMILPGKRQIRNTCGNWSWLILSQLCYSSFWPGQLHKDGKRLNEPILFWLSKISLISDLYSEEATA